MSILSPSLLETLDYNASGWNFIFDKDFELLAKRLLKISALQDVDLTGLITNSILVWSSTSAKWKPRIWTT